MFDPVASRRDDDVYAVAGLVDEHAVVAWLYPVNGRLSIVELEILQAWPDGAADADPIIAREIENRKERYSKNPPRALPRALLGSIQFREILAANRFVQDSIASQGRPGAITAVQPGEWTASIDLDELRMLQPLLDAVAYVNALAAGLRNPASAIAERHGIDLRSAQNRVGVARNKYGLLTKPPQKGQPGGELTEKARDLLERMDKFSGRYKPEEIEHG